MTAEAPQSPRCEVSLSMPARMKGRWIPASQPGASPDKATGNRWLRRALWGAGAVALVGVTGFFVAPPLVKSLAEGKMLEVEALLEDK